MPTECQVMLDGDSAENIVSDLLSNAVKFTPIGGFVSLELRTEHRAISITQIGTVAATSDPGSTTFLVRLPTSSAASTSDMV